MIYLWLLLIPYLSIAYGIHGGEFIQNVPRIVRNVLCAWPFALVAFLISGHYTPLFIEQYSTASLFFVAAYFGANMGFDNHPLWLKGLINFFPVGALLLPLAYVGSAVAAVKEYRSGAYYGVALALTAMVYA